MRAGRGSLRWLAATLFLLSSAWASGARAAAQVPEGHLATLEVVADMSALSDALWPGWDIHETPFALYDSSGACYLMHHPHPPIGFARVRGRARLDAAVYRATTTTAGVAIDARQVNGVPTAFVDISAFAADPLAVAVREAFNVRFARECPRALAPVDLVAGYPVEPQHLAMADIECDLLRRAVRAPADSLTGVLQEFVSVRALRRVHMGPRFVDYERWLEMRDGMPLYIGERARLLAGDHARGKAASLLGADAAGSLDLMSALHGTEDLEWYRTGRFACSGAGVCLLLDRLGTDWQREVRERCVDPYEVLLRLVPEPLPKAADVFAQHHLEERTAQKRFFAEAAKSDGERLFESVTRGPAPLLFISTNLLSSVSVSYDRQHIVPVDGHREVHTRVIKVEYSGGTHVHLSGRPVAAVLGDGELAYTQFVTSGPPDLSVTADGAPLELSEGIHEVRSELLVEGEGISIQASSAVVIVGHERIAFVLQQ